MAVEITAIKFSEAGVENVCFYTVVCSSDVSLGELGPQGGFFICFDVRVKENLYLFPLFMSENMRLASSC